MRASNARPQTWFAGRHWAIAALAGLALVALPGCILDSALGTAAGRDHVIPPPPPPSFVIGQFGESGVAVTAFGPTRDPRPAFATTADGDGAFEIELSNVEGFTNITLVGTSGGIVLMAIIPEIPAVESVWEPSPTVDIEVSVPEMHPIDAMATAITLLIETGQRNNGSNLGTLDPSSTTELMQEMAAAIGDGDANFVDFLEIVERLLAAAADANVPVFLTPDRAAETGSSLNQAFLDAVEIDYDDSGEIDTDTVAFEQAIVDALEGVGPEICIDPDNIRVVFQLDFNPGLIDGNCEARPRDQWFFDGSIDDNIPTGRQIYITGGVNEFVIGCDQDPDYEYCVTAPEIESVNVQFDNEPSSDWTPNITPMYDDGTHGDVTADDGIYTVVIDMPVGVRVGYKYTWGERGSIWTGTEEWPGNGRLLEAFDVNGDNVVVRFDNFGDEATNKDRVNGREREDAAGTVGSIVWTCSGEGAPVDPEGPNRCGPVDNGEGVIGWTDANRAQDQTWAQAQPEGEAPPLPYFDFREMPTDLDGDCVPDAFPPPGPVTPITIPCP